ncbi:MAG TPA: YggT family protein [Clostridiales bacterium UBA8153]|nr:YggT family protein [Clostridiales bacterium UBA8153]
MVWAIIAQALMSWFRPRSYNRTYYRVLRFLQGATDPLLEPIRRLLPASGGLDFSPLVAIVLLQLLRSVVAPLLP